jgi:hypothetical protein
MFASFEAGAPIVATMRICGYGSRVALRLPGTTWIDSIFKEPRHKSAFSRRDALELCRNHSPLKTEGAGNAGRPLRPQSRVQCVGSTRGSHHGHTGSPGIPCAMVLTVSFVLSPATGLVCHRHRRKLPFANLTPASGRQDHTTSPSASQRPRQQRRPRPPHPAPTSVTIAIRPSFGTGQCGGLKMFLPSGKAKNFCKQD